jgi:hypothetical protein
MIGLMHYNNKLLTHQPIDQKHSVSNIDIALERLRYGMKYDGGKVLKIVGVERYGMKNDGGKVLKIFCDESGTPP